LVDGRRMAGLLMVLKKEEPRIVAAIFKETLTGCGLALTCTFC